MSVSPYFAPKHTSVTQHNSGTQNARVSTCPSYYQYLIDTLTYSHSSALCHSNCSRKNNDANSKQKSSCWHLISLRRRGQAWLWRALQGRSSVRQDFDRFGRHQTSKTSSTCNFISLSEITVGSSFPALFQHLLSVTVVAATNAIDVPEYLVVYYTHRVPATCFGHSCDHPQGDTDQTRVLLHSVRIILTTVSPTSCNTQSGPRKSSPPSVCICIWIVYWFLYLCYATDPGDY
jgi:hypothetical protein